MFRESWIHYTVYLERGWSHFYRCMTRKHDPARLIVSRTDKNKEENKIKQDLVWTLTFESELFFKSVVFCFFLFFVFLFACFLFCFVLVLFFWGEFFFFFFFLFSSCNGCEVSNVLIITGRLCSIFLSRQLAHSHTGISLL